MQPLDILSEAVIDTLKEFSAGKRPLTPATLKEAFCGKEEIISLLTPVLDPPAKERWQELSSAEKKLARVSLSKSKTPEASNVEQLSELRNAFSKILNSLGPAIKSEYENRFSELQQNINECESPLPLGMLGEQIAQMAGELINEAIHRMQFSNDFLVELSKDLYKMEEQLSSYQTYNRETHQINNEFNDNMLSYTGDMYSSFNSGSNPNDIRNLITSKLDTISKAIETKRQSDTTRQLEADSKIAKLQSNLKIYEHEILQVKERSESLEKEVLLDALTQINNRRAYDLKIIDNLRSFHRSGDPFSLILMDVDHFKSVNDDYGHKAGDKCLQEIAKLVKSSLRQSDFLARYGGEEFIAILNGSDAKSARTIAEKIRSCIEKARFYYIGKIIPITISLGVTEIMATDTEAEIPFMRADEAMYRAKQDGRNRVRLKTDLSLCKTPDYN